MSPVETVHFKNICSCGTIIDQCRCMSKDKKVTVIQNGCPECKKKLEKVVNQ